MLDVVPYSTPQSAAARGRPPSRSRASRHVLKIQWKLPARLRKSARQQLAVQGFRRRPLNTQRIVGEPATRAERRRREVERRSRPQLRLISPPYMGSIMKGALDRGGRARQWPQHDFPRAPATSVQPAAVASPRVIAEPKRALRLPFHISVWPMALFGRSHVEEGTPRRVVAKKKVPIGSLNLSLLLAGCLFATGVIWNLQGAGQGWKVFRSVEHQAQQALARLTSARSALAEADFARSETAFADAEVIIASARAELEGALSTSRHALKLVDVTGTVRSGEALLAGGEALTQAGQHVSRALAALLSADVLINKEASSESNSLIAATRQARSEFMQAEDLLAHAEKEFAVVQSSLLPAEVQTDVKGIAAALPRIRTLLAQFDEQADGFLTLLGHEREREYLVLFANNHELRPVGGFIGSLGLISIDQGVVEEIDVKTVYEGDGQLKDFIAPPDPLTPIVNRWYLRDSNWFVDYAVSAAKAAQFFEKEGGQTVDGVILLTPQVIQDLLRAAGPISMPGYDVVVTADNFTEVTQREVTYEYDRSLNRPKQFLADLTPILLNRLFQAEETEPLALLSVLTRNLAQKHLLLFFRDDELQKKVVELGWGGKLPPDAPHFLMVNNANIGGHKSDQFIEQEIDYRLEVDSDGTAAATVAVRRTHRGPSEKGDYPYSPGEDPAVKDNIVYQRVLVPAGATLIEARGFSPAATVPRLVEAEEGIPLSVDADVAEWQRGQVAHKSGTMVGREAGYTFFANWVITPPGQTNETFLRYQLPGRLAMPGMIDEASRLSTYIAKQPGEARTSLRVALQLPEEMRMITHIPENGVTPVSASELVFRGELSQDLVLGAVFERR